MTNKKAIKVLENIEYYLKTHTNESCEEEHTALALAIKALEKIDLIEFNIYALNELIKEADNDKTD